MSLSEHGVIFFSRNGKPGQDYGDLPMDDIIEVFGRQPTSFLDPDCWNWSPGHIAADEADYL